MSYVEATLAPQEEVLAKAQFNWTYSVDPWVWALLGFAPLLYAGAWHGVHGEPLGDPFWIYGLTAFSAVLSVIVIIGHVIHLQTTEITITSSRFVYKTGLVSRDTKEVSLNNIEEINLQQSILGRMFGYGQMTIRGTGVGMIRLPDIDDPIRIRRCIETARAKLRAQRNGAADAPSLEATKEA